MEWVAKKDICRVLLEDQVDFVHDFLSLTCTSRMPSPYQNWCVQDDSYRPMWYNTGNRTHFEIQFERPAHIPEGILIPPPQPIMPTSRDEHIFSRFIFLDETTEKIHIEYIEPLVSHLRFPLAKCIPNGEADSFRGYIIPPPPMNDVKKYYFDAGASSWAAGSEGPSLSYFHHMWARHGMEFDEIFAFEMKTDAVRFAQSVPASVKDHVHYQQCAVTSDPRNHSLATPFLPTVIAEKTMAEAPNTYIFFKLDIDSGGIENAQIDYILNDRNNTIDELAYEHHTAGNYLMARTWGFPKNTGTLFDSYQVFLKLRQKGIRAHSWI